MKKLDKFEKEILAEYDSGELKSTSPSKVKLTKFKATASAHRLDPRSSAVRQRRDAS